MFPFIFQVSFAIKVYQILNKKPHNTNIAYNGLHTTLDKQL